MSSILPAARAAKHKRRDPHIRLFENMARAAGCPKGHNPFVWALAQGLISRGSGAELEYEPEFRARLEAAVRRDEARKLQQSIYRERKREERERAHHYRCSRDFAERLRDLVPTQWLCVAIPDKSGRIKCWQSGDTKVAAEVGCRLMVIRRLEEKGFGKEAGLAAWEFWTYPPRRDRDDADQPALTPVAPELVQS
jgi:hypothetical protein